MSKPTPQQADQPVAHAQAEAGSWSDSHARFLAAAGAALASSLDYEQILARLCDLAVPYLADWCSVALAEADGAPRRIALTCADPARRPLAEAISAIQLPADTTLGHVIATGEPELIDPYPPDFFEHSATPPAYKRLLQQLSPRSTLGLPLIVRGQSRGAIAFTMTESGRTFTAELIALAEELARRAAIAVDNALLYRDAQRRLAELATVQRVAQAITSAVRLDQLCATVVDQIARAFGYRLVSIYLRDGDVLRLQTWVGYAHVMHTIRDDQGVIGRVTRTGQAVFVRVAADDPDFIVVVPGINQGVFVPIRYADGPVLGVLSIESTGDPVLTDDDLSLLCLLADQISVAVVNARLFERVDEAASRFYSLMESAGSVIIGLDRDLRVSEFNREAERVFGCSRDEALGHAYLDHFVAPPDRSVVAALVHGAIAGATASPFETTVVATDRRERAFLWTITCRTDAAGTPAELLVIGQDISARRDVEEERLALERKMLEAQRLESLGVLAGGIAHDFNNLLSAIRGNASLLLLDLPAGSEAYRSAHQIELVTARAADLVGQMLAYAGRGHFVMQSLDLNALVAEMILLLRASISKGAALIQHLSPGLPPVIGDPAQLRQVLMNLIVNASEALGPAGGSITITTTLRPLDTPTLARASVGADLPANRYVCLTVADSGVGMDEATRARIFDPFFTTKFAGRGLGLAAVLGIVRSHQGALLVESEPAHGSTFTLVLPAGPPRPTELVLESLPAGPLAAPRPRSHPLVLVIDDEDDVRRTLTRILERGGYTVVSVADGDSALAISRELRHRLGAVLMDLTIPRFSAEQLFRELRRDRPGLPVILMSGYTAAAIGPGLADEMSAFVQKPFSAIDILAAVAQAIADAR